MQGKLSPYFIEVTENACLKSFWRKRALRVFLSQNHISDTALSQLQALTKREFLDWLFLQLLSKKDNRGHKLILEIARNLAAQCSFPDLQDWEDSAIKIRDAVESVNQLKVELTKLDAQIDDKRQKEERRKEAEQRRQEIISSQQTLQKLKARLESLAAQIGTTQAGYDFERWFYDLTDYFEVECRRPYKTGGRQIDGTITLEGTTFLVELKFTQNQTGFKDISDFYRKVTSRADNTMGVFVSMAGFNENAKVEASGERTPLLLLDYNHLYHILSGVMTLPEVISRVKRHAAQTAEAYLAAKDFGK